MSKDLNKVMLIGRLGKDPEVRITGANKTVTQFTVASGRSWKDADGNRQEETEWFNVVAWNQLGEICGEYLRKGMRVYVEGRLQTRSWEDEESGQKRYKTEVVASDMIMLEQKGAVQQDDEDEAPAPARTQPARQQQRQVAPTPTKTPVAAGARRQARPTTADNEDLPF